MTYVRIWELSSNVVSFSYKMWMILLYFHYPANHNAAGYTLHIYKIGWKYWLQPIKEQSKIEGKPWTSDTNIYPALQQNYRSKWRIGNYSQSWKEKCKKNGRIYDNENTLLLMFHGKFTSSVIYIYIYI